MEKHSQGPLVKDDQTKINQEGVRGKNVGRIGALTRNKAAFTTAVKALQLEYQMIEDASKAIEVTRNMLMVSRRAD